MKKLLICCCFLLTVVQLWAYEVIVFGDVHFDADGIRDPKEKRPKYQIEETKRNLAAWSRERTPALLDRAAQKMTSETALVVQLGDLVQGDFGSKMRHQKALDLVLAEFQKRFRKVPFVMIPGNHDCRGVGAREGYQEKITKYLNKTLNLQLSPGNPVQYVWTKDRDLFVMLDCNLPDPVFLERTIASHPDLRHLFVLTHFPVIPTSYPGAVYWKKMAPAERRKLINILAKHHAIVLTAHIHQMTRIEWQNKAGSITQLSLFSIFPAKPKPYRMTRRNTKEPLSQLSPAQKQKLGQKVRVIQSEFLPGYRLYEDILPQAGFIVLKLGEQGVTAELFCAKSLKPTGKLKLR